MFTYLHRDSTDTQRLPTRGRLSGSVFDIVQELCESRLGGRPARAVRPNEPSGFRRRKAMLEPCFGIGLSLSLICQPTSEDIKEHYLPSVFDLACLASRLVGEEKVD